MSAESWKPEIFEQLYARERDPWKFETSRYEQAKYDDTIVQLGGGTFACGLEVGCSIGVLTARLALTCRELTGLDCAAAAIEQARIRCAQFPHVTLACATVPQQWPDGSFDLIVISEILYFLSQGDISELCRRVLGAARPRCTILLVNWTGQTDTPCDGNRAASWFVAGIEATGAGFTAEVPLFRESYRIDRMVRIGT